MNKHLYGVIEWIASQEGSTINFHGEPQAGNLLISGEVKGMKYRYFLNEGWIGLKTEACQKGKSIECRTLDYFIMMVDCYHVIKPITDQLTENKQSTPRPLRLKHI